MPKGLVHQGKGDFNDDDVAAGKVSINEGKNGKLKIAYTKKGKVAAAKAKQTPTSTGYMRRSDGRKVKAYAPTKADDAMAEGSPTINDESIA